MFSFISRFRNAWRLAASNRYESAKPSPHRARFSGVPADAADELPPHSRRVMVNNAREAFANNGFVRDIVAANDIYSVGDGIQPQACTADAGWNAAAEAYFARWSRDALLNGSATAQQCTSLVSQRLDVDGEVFFVKTREPGSGAPRLVALETHRLCDAADDPRKGWRQGIRFDAFGRPAAYRFFLGSDEEETTDVPAEFVIHAFIAETFSSVHGMPQIQHALNSIQDTKEILSLLIARGKLQNSLALTANSDRSVSEGHTGGLIDRRAPSPKRTDPDELKKVLPAGILNLQTDEKLESFVPNAPGTDMLDALAQLDRRSCGGVLPPDFFDPSKIGGASTRMVVSKAARHFERRQTHLVNAFLRPLWLFVIGDAIARGRLPAAEDWTEVEWACPKSITVDAGREAAQDRADVLGGFNSFDDYCASRGKDARRELPRIIANRAEIRRLEAAAGIPDELSILRRNG